MQSVDDQKPSTLVGHPSLPMKPPPPLPNSVTDTEKPAEKSSKYNGDKARTNRAEPMHMSGKGTRNTREEADIAATYDRFQIWFSRFVPRIFSSLIYALRAILNMCYNNRLRAVYISMVHLYVL